MIGGLENKVYDYQGCTLGLPSSHLLKGSLQVMYPGTQFRDWNKNQHATSFDLMCRITDFWANNRVTITPSNTVIPDKTGIDQYLIYGKIDFINPFKWEIVPYENCKTLLGRIIQQVRVLYRTVFGGIESTVRDVIYLSALASKIPNAPEKNVSPKGSDPFCKDEVIDRQWVLKGKHVTVLLNHAPIGFGGEKLDFLVVPNAHRERFTDLTKEEYCESMEATAKIIDHLVATRTSIKNVYMMHKTGVIAGQTVNHCLWRFIASSSATQEFWGKLTVLRNILWGSLWGSSPMNKEAFAEKVKGLREELKDIKLD